MQQSLIGYRNDQVNQINRGQNLGTNEDYIHRKTSDFPRYLVPNGHHQQKPYVMNSTNLHQNAVGFQRNCPEEMQQWNSQGFYRENQSGSGVGVQFDQMNNGQNYRSSYSEPDAFYCQSESQAGRNSINLQQNKIGYQNFSNQDLDGPYDVDPEQFCHENSHGHEKRDPISNEDQNLSVTPLISREVITYEDNLFKFDEFCKVGKVKEAIAVLAALEKIGKAIDIPRYLMLIESCGKEKCLEKAQLIHEHLKGTVKEVEVRVHNKILDMYSKCGLMDDAYQLFEKMPQRNITSWETMITGLANNGLGEEAIDLFTQFKEMGLKPDGGLFTAVFYTCGVLGAVDQGMLYFNSMKVDYGIAPLMEHYISIVDMFGRSGHLDEALEFVEMMPLEPNIDVWETLMNYCWVNGYVEIGDRCAEIVEQHDSSRLTEQAKKGLLPVKTLESIKENEVKQNCDELNVKHYMHEFVAGRPENNMLYEQIRCLAQQMKEAGYVPDLACTLHDVDPENREEALMYHSERLAIVHGLMTSPARRPIRVIKNLRVCRDCHAVMKIISKLTGRLIIARDTKRFHHVENGVCSCNDFW